MEKEQTVDERVDYYSHCTTCKQSSNMDVNIYRQTTGYEYYKKQISILKGGDYSVFENQTSRYSLISLVW